MRLKLSVSGVGRVGNAEFGVRSAEWRRWRMQVPEKLQGPKAEPLAISGQVAITVSPMRVDTSRCDLCRVKNNFFMVRYVKSNRIQSHLIKANHSGAHRWM